MKNKVKLSVAVMMTFGLTITNRVNAEELEVGILSKVKAYLISVK